MKNKLILLFSLTLQLGVCLASEDANNSWPNWLWRTAGSAWTSAKETASQATQKAKTSTSQWLNSMDPQLQKPEMFLVGAMSLPIMEILQRFDDSKNPVTGPIVSALAVAGATAALLYGFNKIKNYYYKEQPTKQLVRNAIAEALNDTDTYPTRSTKLHALLKKNEFFMKEYAADEKFFAIVDEVCKELTGEVAKQRNSDLQKNIDLRINQIRQTLINYPSLESKITYLKNEFTMQLEQGSEENPKEGLYQKQAVQSLLNRLVRQAVVQEASPIIFQKSIWLKPENPVKRENLVKAQLRQWWYSTPSQPENQPGEVTQELVEHPTMSTASVINPVNPDGKPAATMSLLEQLKQRQ